MLKSVLEYFFPNNCIHCGKRLLRTEDAICLNCVLLIPKTHYHRYADNPIMKTFWGKVNCKSASAIYQFHTKSPLQRLIHELKYNNNTIIGIELGQLCALEIQNNLNFKRLEAIVPIPLHPAKKALRGYNQCDLIAEGMSNILQIEVKTDLFKRTRNNPSQTQKNKYDRWKNATDLFELNQKLPKGEWLLIDDIFTTGSTMTSCIKAVPNDFHNKINVLTVGYAP